MRPGEHLWFQMLVQPATNDWSKKGVQYVNKLYGVEEKNGNGIFSSSLQGALSIPSGVIQEATGVDMSALMFGSSEEKRRGHLESV